MNVQTLKKIISDLPDNMKVSAESNWGTQLAIDNVKIKNNELIILTDADSGPTDSD
jgi:hypothetical protein